VSGLGKCVTCQIFEFLFFLSFFAFFSACPGRISWPIGTIYTPKRVFPAKDVPFVGLDNIRLHLGGQIPQKTSPKWAGIGISQLNRRIDKKLIRRWDSERELSLRRHCTRTKNTIDCCINSATDGFLQRKFTKFSEITQCNGHYAVQGHSRLPILVPIES